jgi:hypothetical protein
MKQDYIIHPSMLGIKSGALWYKTGAHPMAVFDQSHPLYIDADTCSQSNVCVYYISPIWEVRPDFKVALMGDFNKWAPVSRQRFTSIIIDPTENQVRVTYQGVPNEEIYLMTYYPSWSERGQACFVNENGTGWAIITPTISTCTEID